jgi:hypothetical protein
MTPTQGTIDITAAPRAVLRESVRLLYRMLGEDRLGTARGNAWTAVCADRERAVERAEVVRLLAAARARTPEVAAAGRSQPFVRTGRGSLLNRRG